MLLRLHGSLESMIYTSLLSLRMLRLGVICRKSYENLAS